jgi:hypothetical protein
MLSQRPRLHPRSVILTAVLGPLLAALTLVAGAPQAGAVVKIANDIPCTTGDTCYRQWDIESPGGSTGTINVGHVIKMSRSGASYCPLYAYAGPNNTSKAETFNNLVYVYTDVNGNQHYESIGGTSGFYRQSLQAGEQHIIKTPYFSWWQPSTNTCSFWIPRHQSDTLNVHPNSPNGIYVYGYNSQQSWQVRVDLY